MIDVTQEEGSVKHEFAFWGVFNSDTCAAVCRHTLISVFETQLKLNSNFVYYYGNRENIDVLQKSEK
jgi:hypothetical protein